MAGKSKSAVKIRDNENRNAGLKKALSCEPKTPLGKRLLEIRNKVVASGEPLLDWDDIERELEERRGGIE